MSALGRHNIFLVLYFCCLLYTFGMQAISRVTRVCACLICVVLFPLKFPSVQRSRAWRRIHEATDTSAQNEIDYVTHSNSDAAAACAVEFAPESVSSASDMQTTGIEIHSDNVCGTFKHRRSAGFFLVVRRSGDKLENTWGTSALDTWVAEWRTQEGYHLIVQNKTARNVNHRF